MEKFFTSALGMITLFVLGALAFYLISGGFSGNWNPFMASAPTPTPAKGTTTRTKDGLSNPTGDELRTKNNLIDSIINKYQYNIKYPNGLNKIRQTLMAMSIPDLTRHYLVGQTICDCAGQGDGSNTNWVFAGHGNCSFACGFA